LYKNTYAVVTGVTGTFSQVAFIYGIQNLMMAMIDDPAKVRKTLDRRHKVVLSQIDQLCDCGVRFIWIGEGLGSGSLISPEQYRDFVLPYEQSIAGRLREREVLSILHICGDTRKTLRYIADLNVDGFDLDYPVTIPEALKALPPEITIKGNINPGLFLPGNSVELKKACEQAVKAIRHSQSFILSTGCLVPRDSDKEAFYTMRSICEM
jgi:uroporphyrinogen decarboxylase